MNGSDAIWWMIGVCIVIALCLIFSKQIKILVKFILNSIIGAAGLFCTNFVLAPLGLTVGINSLTIIFIGILGLPGLITLYLLKLILGNI